jgi:hypothetical protein
MSQVISSGAAVLHDLPVHKGPQPLAVEVPPGDQPRPERRQRVRAFHPQHRSGVGVPEVVQPADHELGGVLGDCFTGSFLSYKRDEIERFERFVTDWEFREYAYHL